MAWYSDEEYELGQDIKTKRSIAASAFKRRTHCGRGGRVRFPSDNLTRKELKAMNGVCIEYASLKRPMNWSEFKTLPDDLKKEYINGLRERFDVPDHEIAKMFAVADTTLSRFFKCYGLSVNHKRGNRKWDEEGWERWRGTILELPETPVEAVEAEINIPTEGKAEENQGGSCGHAERKRAIPYTGDIKLKGSIEEIVETLRMLLSGAEVILNVSWTVPKPDEDTCRCTEV